jgi:hypothetical protein
MWFAADYSETLEVSLTLTDRIGGHLYVSQSVVCEMAAVQERALCVGWLFATKSVAQTQRNYRTQFNKQPPSFLETGSAHDRKRSRRPGVRDKCVETIRASFVRSPTKSMELRVNCYSHVQRYTKFYIIHNFSKPRVDFVDTLYISQFRIKLQYNNLHRTSYHLNIAVSSRTMSFNLRSVLCYKLEHFVLKAANSISGHSCFPLMGLFCPSSLHEPYNTLPRKIYRISKYCQCAFMD